jgi:predicted porin
MKKSLLALAVLGAFAGAAQAQSNVTIFGIIDGGVRHQTNVNGNGDNRTTVSSTGTNTTNRIGFRGVEDLGGGLSARFHLESDFNIGTGALPSGALWNRGAYVGLGGGWGWVDVGRQFSVNFKTIGAYDPFNYNYTTIIPLAGAGAGGGTPASNNPALTTFGGNRFNNDIQYTGAFGPVTVRAEYALGETPGSTSTGSAYALGATYANGPLSFGGAYTQKKPVLNAVVGAQDDKQWTVGGAYTFGDFRVAAGYIDEKQTSGTIVADARVKNAWAGLSYNVTPAFKLTGALYQTKTEVPGDTAGTDGKKNLWIVAAGYSLSKRTTLYAEVDRANLSGNLRRVGSATVGPIGLQDNQTGFSVGVAHQF